MILQAEEIESLKILERWFSEGRTFFLKRPWVIEQTSIDG